MVTDDGPRPNAFDLEAATVSNDAYRTVAWTGAQVHRETPQRLAGRGARMPRQMAGDVGLQVKDAALMRRLGPAVA